MLASLAGRAWFRQGLTHSLVSNCISVSTMVLRLLTQVLRAGGCLLDAVSLAIWGALKALK